MLCFPYHALIPVLLSCADVISTVYIYIYIKSVIMPTEKDLVHVPEIGHMALPTPDEGGEHLQMHVLLQSAPEDVWHHGIMHVLVNGF